MTRARRTFAALPEGEMMCCFSRPVKDVADTNIFARAAQRGRQYLAYSMWYTADEDLAMIIPIPVPENSAEDAVSFISLENYAGFFNDLKNGFPRPLSSRGLVIAAAGSATKLAVVEVGKFEASFVPTLKDFARLDERFQLPDGVWGKLPQYKEFGFAVFKLKNPKAGVRRVHPMAFEFPRRDPTRLFFPTVHIHDGGTVPAKARFDHDLYCQMKNSGLMDWEESPGLANTFVKIEQARGIVDGDAHVYRKRMIGSFENKDVTI